VGPKNTKQGEKGKREGGKLNKIAAKNKQTPWKEDREFNTMLLTGPTGKEIQAGKKIRKFHQKRPNGILEIKATDRGGKRQETGRERRSSQKKN